MTLLGASMGGVFTLFFVCVFTGLGPGRDNEGKERENSQATMAELRKSENGGSRELLRGIAGPRLHTNLCPFTVYFTRKTNPLFFFSPSLSF